MNDVAGSLLSDTAADLHRRRNRVREIATNLLADHGDVPVFSDDDTLSEAGLTSLDMVKLMLAVEAAFGIEIPQEDITPESFRSIATIADLSGRLF